MFACHDHATAVADAPIEYRRSDRATAWSLRLGAGVLLAIFAIEPSHVARQAGAAEQADAAATAENASLPTAEGDRRPVEFVRDVVPALTKAGCNAGACHGSFQGRGGLRLSLLGFDPAADYQALVQEARGRRISPAAPDQSLLLKKAAAAVPHGGGRRLDVDSSAYRLLHDWVAQGASPGPSGDDLRQLRVARLVVEPAEALLKPGDAIALQVRAVWSDGREQDVRRLALYESTQESVVSVSGAGEVVALGPGQASVTLQYQGQVAIVRALIPYAAEPVDFDWEPRNFIDEHAARLWRKLGIAPAPLADDAEFVRRAYLDIIGTLPQPAETLAFLNDAAPDKRDKLIDALLDRSEYVDFWSLRWGDWLRAHRRYLGAKGLASFRSWLGNGLRENRPIDELTRELLTARGNLYHNGPTAFYFVDRDPLELAETTSQIFLGVRLQCARCHHHPFEVWSQDDYYGLAAFFARLERKDTGESGSFGGSQSLRLGAAGQVKHPETGLPVAPRVLVAGAEPTPVDSSRDEREALAGWLTSTDNPYFARNIVNRYWAQLTGRGLYSPVDDQRATNPPVHPELLDALAEDFTRHGFDLRRLVQTICRSRAYQLASELAPQRDRDGACFTHRTPRPLDAEVLLDAINQACGVNEGFAGFPAEQRAVALPDTSVASNFLQLFGRPQRTSTCDCQRERRADLKQVLHLFNGPALHAKLIDKRGRIAQALAANKDDEAIVAELYLATLCRPPDEDERALARELIAAGEDRAVVLQDLLWALLNSAEFGFNH